MNSETKFKKSSQMVAINVSPRHKTQVNLLLLPQYVFVSCPRLPKSVKGLQTTQDSQSDYQAFKAGCGKQLDEKKNARPGKPFQEFQLGGIGMVGGKETLKKNNSEDKKESAPDENREDADL